MARGHWLDPFARRLLEATGQLPQRPPAAPQTAPQPDPQIERELLALRLRQQPEHRLRSADEAHHAAALGWRLDVNRASADDWLRLPGIQPAQVDLLLRLQRHREEKAASRPVLQAIPCRAAVQVQPALHAACEARDA